MSTTATSCPSCGPKTDDHKKLPEEAISEAIARGEDLGGVFEFGAAVAHARVAIGIGGDVYSMDANRAAVAVIHAHAKVAKEFDRLAGRPQLCDACEMRNRLDWLIDVATDAVADARNGTRLPGDAMLRALCSDLAAYVGDDDYPDPEATRRVLERVRDVFVAALARMVAALAGEAEE